MASSMMPLLESLRPLLARLGADPADPGVAAGVLIAILVGLLGVVILLLLGPGA